MKLGIASDHAGYEEKSRLVDYLRANGHDVIDFGPDSADSVDYPDFAALVAKAVANNQVERGILICGTGIGMAIAANKIDGVRAANATSPEFAALSREHNDANIVTLSARFVDNATNCKILDAFIATEFAGGRHKARVQKIMDLQDN